MEGVLVQLNRTHQDYSYVTNAMRQANLPEVFAGIPFYGNQISIEANLSELLCRWYLAVYARDGFSNGVEDQKMQIQRK